MNIHDRSSLLLVPSGYKDGKLYSQVPNSGDGDFTFTRGSNLAATRVGADGLIEKGRENLLTHSNNFSNWNQYTGVTMTSGQSGYDGSSDAWKFERDTTSPYLAITQSPNASGVVTFSVYAKEGTIRYLNFYDPVSSAQIWFDLQAGTLNAQIGTRITTNIEAAGNGFYRCSVTWNASGTTECRLYPTNIGGSYSNTAGYIYIQDAQLEAGLVATDYIESGATTGKVGILENQPRLDYSGGASRASLLLEPQRTNVFPQSEYLLGGYYNITASTIITTNYGTSPEGLVNSSRLDSANANGGWYTSGIVVSSGETYTCSIFAKLVSGSESNVVRFGFSLNGDKLSLYDLSDGTIDYNHPDVTTSIQDYGNGWYRLIQTITTTSSGTLRQVFYSYNTAGDYEIYGQQVEAGSYATSYIPTYGSAVTRNADDLDRLTNLSTNGIANNYSTTLFFEGTNFKTLNNTRYVTLYNSSVSSNPRVLLFSTNSNSSVFYMNLQYRATGQTDAIISSGNMSYNTKFKAIMRLDGTSLSMFIDGTKYSTTIVQADAIEVLDLADIANDLSHTISQLAIFPTALSDTDCELLTGTTYESFAAMAEALNYTVYE